MTIVCSTYFNVTTRLILYRTDFYIATSIALEATNIVNVAKAASESEDDDENTEEDIGTGEETT